MVNGPLTSIPVHPNVDKRSFIRWKQRDIHDKRDQRRAEMKNIKASDEMNQVLLNFLQHSVQSLALNPNDSQILDRDIESYLWHTLPSPPSTAPSYKEMIKSLFDQVKEEKISQTSKSYSDLIQEHIEKIRQLTDKNSAQLAELEKEESMKITSDDLKIGFDSSSVTKSQAKPDAIKPGSVKQKVQSIEVLNSEPLDASDGARADVEDGGNEGGDDIPERINASELGKSFAAIPIGDYMGSFNFITNNIDVLKESESDGLLVEAFRVAQQPGASIPQQVEHIVHQALLLQYCRSFGSSKLQVFFKGLSDKTHKARVVFYDDVKKTTTRIITRAKEIQEEDELTKMDGVELIQLEAANPDMQISFNIPPKDSPTEEGQQARAVFESFPLNLQKAIENSSLEEVNAVLGKMAVEEAEEIVSLLSRTALLNMEERIIDLTKGESLESVRQREQQEQFGELS